MSITSEITALTTDRNNIRTALVNKGISAASAHGFDDFAGDIEDIPAGYFASIVVTAPTGSTVTCNGTAVAEVSGTWTFSGLGAGTYTIVATLGDKTKTQTVLIDTVGVYEVTIVYALYLYNEGDECTSVTGGWSSGFVPVSDSYYSTKQTFQKLTSQLYFSTSGRGSIGSRTNNKIDTTGYTTLKVVVDEFTKTGNYIYTRAWVNPTYPVGSSVDASMGLGSVGTKGKNISSLNKEEYFIMGVSAEQDSSTLKISAIWLE